MTDKEPTTVGLTNATKQSLDRLKNEGYFNEMLDAYKFAVAYALACNAISPPLSNTTTIFNVGTLDKDRMLYDAVEALRPEEDEPVYKTVERLAEWGIKEMMADAERGSIDFSNIFTKVQTLNEDNS
ncbi:MAG: hypothetical protein H6863_03790 [Rhodospirillales bacterium]|jgi:hypothetical protein|nr:hypothetical protein [Rhodospirillales bacterium]